MAAPAALRAAAAALEVEAASAAPVLDDVRSSFGPHVWRGPAADRFQAELDVQSLRLASAIDDLRFTAGRMRAVADAIEAEAAAVAAAPRRLATARRT